MKTVYKYPLRLADVQVIRGPGLGKVLSSGYDPPGRLSVWVEADTDAHRQIVRVAPGYLDH